MKRNELTGIVAGIVSGAAYGTNALFAKPLMDKGVSIGDMLLVRYALAAVIVGAIAFFRAPTHSNPLRIRPRQIGTLIALGVLFAMSSITLFEAYASIPSGVGATLVYLYPVFTALIMMVLGVMPSVKTIVAIASACVGVALMCLPGSSGTIEASGVVLAIVSALAYALYLILVGKSRRVADLGVQTITIYALLTGVVLFLVMHTISGVSTLSLCTSLYDWVNLVGLGIFPTSIAMVGLSVATRRIGATRAAILGVFEPITSIVIGIMLFHEPFTLLIALGMIVCLVAMFFIKP